MKKILCALLTVSMLLCIAGCGDSDDESSKKSSSESSIYEIDAESSVDDESSLDDEEFSIDDSEASEMDDEILDSEDSNSETDEEGYIYTGETYTFKYNDKWSLTEDVAVFDCTLNYIAGTDEMDEATNIGFQKIPGGGVIDLEEMADTMIGTYNGKDGYFVESNESAKFKDYDAYEIVLEVTSGSATLKMRQIMFKNDSNIYVIDITAEESKFDTIMNEVDEVINTFEFID